MLRKPTLYCQKERYVLALSKLQGRGRVGNCTPSAGYMPGIMSKKKEGSVCLLLQGSLCVHKQPEPFHLELWEGKSFCGISMGLTWPKCVF